MKCRRCMAKMHVIRTQHWGQMTVRDLKCKECGNRDRSFETLADEKPSTDLHVAHKPA